ncbi:MAG: ABC transporter ATP-binding protein [Gemmatimonadales bacterium]
MSTAIAIEHLSKRYQLGRKVSGMLRETIVDFLSRSGRPDPDDDATVLWALRDVSIEVKAGEILGIVGRNGAGKSTLLKIVSRISRPTEGRVRVRGRIASLLEVGTGFHEELTGRENVYLSGCILGMPRRRIDECLDSIIAFAGVERFVDTPIKRYSSGMRLRLGFAVAAHLDSDILVVDEVLAVGDGDFQRKCLAAMGELQQQGRTVLFVSHNLAAVENLCTRAVWLDRGELRDDGTPAKIIGDYMASFGGGHGGGMDLTEVTDRRGNGSIRFTRLELLDAGREPTASIRSGDTFVLRLHFDARQEMANVIVGVDFYSVVGALVSQVHTYNSGCDFVVVPAGPGYVDVTVKDANFMPGRYTISFFAGSLGNIYHDHLEYCFSFDVGASHRFGLNRGMRNPVMALDSGWELFPG